MIGPLQTRWAYAWLWDPAARRGTLFARNLAALNSLTDGQLGADLPEGIRLALPQAAEAAGKHARGLEAAPAVTDRYRALPYAVTISRGQVECFLALDEWETLIARITQAA